MTTPKIASHSFFERCGEADTQSVVKSLQRVLQFQSSQEQATRILNLLLEISFFVKSVLPGTIKNCGAVLTQMEAKGLQHTRIAA